MVFRNIHSCNEIAQTQVLAFNIAIHSSLVFVYNYLYLMFYKVLYCNTYVLDISMKNQIVFGSEQLP